MFSTSFISLIVSLLFPESIIFFFFIHSFCFSFISSNVDEVLSINPSANVFVLGDFNIHHKDWLTYSGGTDGPGELWLSQMTLLSWLTLLLGSLTVTLTVLFFWIYLFLLMLAFVLQWLSLHWKIRIMLSQFPLTFCKTHSGIPGFIAWIMMTILVLIGTVFMTI